MALTCAVALNTNSYSAGATPPPSASLVVYNPNASPVLITAIQMSAVQAGGGPGQTLPIAQSVPPIGPGQNTLVPALGAVTIGPFPIALSSAAYVAGANPALAQPASAASPNNAQPSQVATYIAQIGALVYGSDGSVNAAAPAGMTVYQQLNGPPGSQGGVLNFASPQNSPGFIVGVP